MEEKTANQTQQEQAPQSPLPQQHSPEWYRAKKHFIIWLALWLGAMPLSIILQIMSRMLFGIDNPMRYVSNLITLLLGLYMFFGWIPALITGLAWNKKQ